MKIFFLTSTDLNAFEKTKIAFSNDGDACTVAKYFGTEAQAILQFAKETCEKTESNAKRVTPRLLPRSDREAPPSHTGPTSRVPYVSAQPRELNAENPKPWLNA